MAKKILTEEIIPTIKEKVAESVVKLYDTYGLNEDGTVTQRFINDTLNTADLAIGYSATTESHGTALGDRAHCDGYGVAIGSYVRGSGLQSVAIGSSTITNANDQVALGYDSACSTLQGQVSLGAYSSPTRQGEVNIGLERHSTGNKVGYKNTKTRVIGGVHAGELDTDAVNVGQMNQIVGNIQTILQEINGEPAVEVA